MEIVRGLFKGRIGSTNPKRMTNSVHVVLLNKTLCGIDYINSYNLGFPENGIISDVNCKKCLKKL